METSSEPPPEPVTTSPSRVLIALTATQERLGDGQLLSVFPCRSNKAAVPSVRPTAITSPDSLIDREVTWPAPGTVNCFSGLAGPPVDSSKPLLNRTLALFSGVLT